jgi:hypothetical protein
MRGGQNGETMLAGPRTLPFCAVCGEYTPHEWIGGDGVVAKVCVPCVEHDLTNLLNQD